MPRSLFRKEAIDAQREKFLGEASVAQPVRMWVYTATACTIALLAIAVAVWGQYTRRERVQGYLASAVGAAEVKMPDAGTLSDVMVKEGDLVVAGTRLARLTIDLSGVNDERGNAAVIEQSDRRKASISAERVQTAELGNQEVRQLRARATDLQNQVRQLEAQLKLQIERYESQKIIAQRWQGLLDNEKFISDIRVRQEQDKVKEEEIRVQEVRRARSVVVGQLSDALAAVPAAEMRNRTHLEQIDQQIAQIQQSIEQRSLDRDRQRREMMITAPIDGTVTNIVAARGQTVAADSRFATLLPANSPLHAELLVPTRAIGFVKPGQPVLMRYDAFPYERFGQYAGKVENVGKDVWTQGAIVGPLAVREAVYRITVVLDRQDISANEQRFPLRAGMVVSADLLLEKRSLLEWLFQPVLQLRRRMSTSTAS